MEPNCTPVLMQEFDPVVKAGTWLASPTQGVPTGSASFPQMVLPFPYPLVPVAVSS